MCYEAADFIRRGKLYLTCQKLEMDFEKYALKKRELEIDSGCCRMYF